MPEMRRESRSGSLARLTGGPLDLLVVGGGIVGSGVARDAALRGLRVGLVDAHDFAFGTSSRSSRLLHGGLRYLAQGRIGLVREASVEKMTIHRIAPHLAEPLPFVFPTYAGTEWKLWKLRVGVKIYDWLCGKRNLGKSSALSREEVMGRLPGINPEGLTGAVRYFDGLTNDARLVLDTIRSADVGGATVRNYTRLVSADRVGDGWQCEIEDAFTGERARVTARGVVNAGGAWGDTFKASKVRLRLTKGVHLVVDRAKLPLPDAVVMAEGKRILFAIPWGERMILGTTDTDYTGATECPTCEDVDVQYVLDVTNRAFPGNVSRDDVISAWSGLRPLIANPNGSPSDISRAHEIRMPEPGWIDVAGGKLTTYRLMAEQTVDLAAKALGFSIKKSPTAGVPLLPESETKFSGILPSEVSREAVRHYCRSEYAEHLDDVMVRRTSWRYYHRDHVEIARKVVEWMGEDLRWSPERQTEETQRYERFARGRGEWEPMRQGHVRAGPQGTAVHV